MARALGLLRECLVLDRGLANTLPGLGSPKRERGLENSLTRRVTAYSESAGGNPEIGKFLRQGREPK